MPTRLRSALVALAAAALVAAVTGCGEINDMLDAGAGNDKAKTKAEKTDGAATGAQSARAKLDAYYNRESRTVEHDPNDPIVTCRLNGSTQFMRKNDCVLRGGTVS